MIVDPESNTIVSDGYNGPPRGGGDLCGGTTCERDTLHIRSGTHMEVGCHHAEMNAILNAARVGVSTLGMHLIVTAEPCKMCARAIHHAGISKVYVLTGNYAEEELTGLSYLKKNGVELERITS